jgi:hypothetical protein
VTSDVGRIERLLADLAAFGGDAVYTAGLGLSAYLADGPEGRVLRNNGRQILIQVATVVEKLPDAFKTAHGDVDWVGIGRMRNLIAHHYDRVDDRLVFVALATRIPDLVARLDPGGSRPAAE